MIGQRVCTAAPSVTGTNEEELEGPEKRRRKAVFRVVFVFNLILTGRLSSEGRCCRERCEYGGTRR